MKRNFFFCIALIAIISIFFGCKKSSSTNQTDKPSEQILIVGKWIYSHDLMEQYSNGQIIKSTPYTYTREDGTFIQFNNDGTGSEGAAGITDATFTYTAPNNMVTVTYPAYATQPSEIIEYQIVKLDSKNMTIVREDKKTDANGKRIGWTMTMYLVK